MNCATSRRPRLHGRPCGPRRDLGVKGCLPWTADAVASPALAEPRGLTYQRRREPSCLPVGTARGPPTRGLKAGQRGHFLVSLLPHPAPVPCPQACSHRDPPASPSGQPPRPGAPGARPRGDAFLTRPPPSFCRTPPPTSVALGWPPSLTPFPRLSGSPHRASCSQ